MSTISTVESPLPGAAVVSVLADRARDDDADHTHSETHLTAEAISRQAHRQGQVLAMPRVTSAHSASLDRSRTSSLAGRRAPAIEVVAIHRETPVVSPASFTAHYEAAVQRASSHSSPLPDASPSAVLRTPDGGEAGVTVADVIAEPITEDEVDEGRDDAWAPAVATETAEYVVTDVADEEDAGKKAEDYQSCLEAYQDRYDVLDGPREAGGGAENIESEVRAAYTAAAAVEEMDEAYEIESDLTAGSAEPAIETVTQEVAQRIAIPETDPSLEPVVASNNAASKPDRTPSTSRPVERTAHLSSHTRPFRPDADDDDEEEDRVEEIPIHASEAAQFVLPHPRRSTTSASSPMRASGSTARGDGSGSRYESPNSARALRLPRGQGPSEVISHPFVLNRRSSSGDDASNIQGGTHMTAPGQNSAGSNADVVNLDEWSPNQRTIPSASNAASPQFKQQPPTQQLRAHPSAGVRQAVEGRIVRGYMEQRLPTRSSVVRESPATAPAAPSQSSQQSSGMRRDSGHGQVRSVSVVASDQVANRQTDATKADASQETIKSYIYVLMAQHGSTVRVWEDRVRTAELYRDKPLRTGGKPDPLRPSDVGFLERANHMLALHLGQLTEARELLGTQLHLPESQRAQPKLVIRDDPSSPLSPARQSIAWTDYCHRFHDSLDDLLVQTDYLQRRVDLLLHPLAVAAATPGGWQMGHRTPRTSSAGPNSRASSVPTTPRGQPGSRRSSIGGSQPSYSRALQPPPPVKDFTWSMPTRATSRRRRASSVSSGKDLGGNATPRRSQITSRPASRASSAAPSPRGQSPTTSTGRTGTPQMPGGHVPAGSSLAASPPLRAERASRAISPHGGASSQRKSSAQTVTRHSVQRGTQQPIAPGHRAPTALSAPPLFEPRLVINRHDFGTVDRHGEDTSRRSGSLKRADPAQTGSSTPPRSQPPTPPVKSPTSPATSAVTMEARMALVTELAALEARADTLQRKDLARARGIFTDLYGTDAGSKQYASWMEKLALNALHAA